MQMEALNCLQAQTLGRSWQSNRTESASLVRRHHRSRRPPSSAVQRLVRWPADLRPALYVQHQIATTGRTGNIININLMNRRSGELVFHVTNGDMHFCS